MATWSSDLAWGGGGAGGVSSFVRGLAGDPYGRRRLDPGVRAGQSGVPPCASANTERNLCDPMQVVVVPLLGYLRATGRSPRLRERPTPSEEGDLVRASTAPLAATSAPAHAPPIVGEHIERIRCTHASSWACFFLIAMLSRDDNFLSSR